MERYLEQAFGMESGSRSPQSAAPANRPARALGHHPFLRWRMGGVAHLFTGSCPLLMCAAIPDDDIKFEKYLSLFPRSFDT